MENEDSSIPRQQETCPDHSVVLLGRKEGWKLEVGGGKAVPCWNIYFPPLQLHYPFLKAAFYTIQSMK